MAPGFAKFVVVKKPATKERQGINPFTKEPTTFKAKLARKVVKARPVSRLRDFPFDNGGTRVGLDLPTRVAEFRR